MRFPFSKIRSPATALLTALAILGLIGSCARQEVRQPVQVSVLQYGPHPVMAAVLEGIRTRLTRDNPPKVELTIFSANFDAASASQIARRMSRSSADVLISISTPAALAVLGANEGAKPHVFTFVTNPDAIGYTEAAPLKNVTGVSNSVAFDSTIALVRAILPDAKTIGYLYSRDEANSRFLLANFERAAAAAGMRIRSLAIAQPSDLRTAARRLAPEVDAFLFGGDNKIASQIGAFVEAATSTRKPLFANDEESVARGALAALSVDYRALGERTADIVLQIADGISPDSIPLVRYPSTRLVVNEATLSFLRLSLPDAYRQRALFLGKLK